MSANIVNNIVVPPYPESKQESNGWRKSKGGILINDFGDVLASFPKINRNVPTMQLVVVPYEVAYLISCFCDTETADAVTPAGTLTIVVSYIGTGGPATVQCNVALSGFNNATSGPSLEIVKGGTAITVAATINTIFAGATANCGCVLRRAG